MSITGARAHGIYALDADTDYVSKTEDQDDVNETQEMDESLSTYFQSAQSRCKRKRSVELQFPSKFMEHLCGLYAPSLREDVNWMLRSARCDHCEYGQVTVVGTAANELVDVLKDVYEDCSMDIIYTITDFVGNALVWLRAPGMSVLKWSAAPNAVDHRRRPVHCALDEGDAPVSSGPRVSVFGGHFGLSDDTFYFSGYSAQEMDEAIADSVDDRDPSIIMDLDWIFAAFMLLGVVPEDEEGNGYWSRYLNHKLLSALPGNRSVRTLMTS